MGKKKLFIIIGIIICFLLTVIIGICFTNTDKIVSMYNNWINKVEPLEEASLNVGAFAQISGSGHSNIYDVLATDDGGYVVAGSFAGECDFDKDGTVDQTATGGFDAFMAKFDAKAKLEWYYNYGTIGNDKFNGISIADNGYVLAGYKYGNSFEDGLLVKVDNSGNKVWEKTFSGSRSDELTNVLVLKNGDIAVTGKFYSNSINLNGATIKKTVDYYGGFVACYSSSGTYKWSKEILGTNNVNVTDVTETSAGIVVSVDFLGSIYVDNREVEARGTQDSILLGYALDGTYSWRMKMGGTDISSIVRLMTDSDDNIVAVGGFNAELTVSGNKITSSDTMTPIVVKYESDGTFISETHLGTTTGDAKFTGAYQTNDGGMIYGGWNYSSSSIDVDGDSRPDIESSSGKSDGFLIKYDKDGEPEWAKIMAGTGYDSTYGVTQLNGGAFVAAGASDSSDMWCGWYDEILVADTYADGYIIAFGDVADEPSITATKESSIGNGGKVQLGDTITYTIRLQNDGKVEGMATVKDSVPNGTSFVTGSVKINNKATSNTAQHLAQGIEVNVGAESSATVSFDVKVNNMTNGDVIENVATVNDVDTNSVRHIYVAPQISGKKSLTTEFGKDYVVEGEKLTYTVTVKNDGEVGKDVTIQSTIPNGTTFVYNSVKVNGLSTTNTANNLANGVVVNVPANGTATMSFDVVVNPLVGNDYSVEITNKTMLDGTELPDSGINGITSITIKKAHITASKESNVANGSKVQANDVITYRIMVRNDGSLAGTAKVKDVVPNGTTFIANSIKVDSGATYYTQQDLVNGIDLNVEAGSSSILSFNVQVNDIDNNDVIENIATVNDVSTNKVSYKYVEPIISSTKTVTTEYGRDYVIEGEKLTYTFTVKNDGGVGKAVVIKSDIPSGTTFVANSIKLDGASVANTASDLANGITMNVPENGTVTLSFETRVNMLPDGEYSVEIKNKATVDDVEISDSGATGLGNVIVKKSSIVATKESSVVSGSKVKVNDVITYTIRLQNSGTLMGTAKVKDSIPVGTSFVANSVKVNNSVTANTEQNLINGIDVTVDAGATATLSFETRVNDISNNDVVENTAVVNDVNTNKVSHTYVEPIISSKKTLTTEFGKDYVVEGEKLTYTITIKNDGGLGKDVLVKSTIPNGTSFVANSVRINDVNSSNTANSLENGIVVNVPEYGTATVSFVVTVNPLGDDEASLEIKNKTTVDDEEVPDPDDGIGAGGSVTVKKPLIVASKESSIASGSKVKLGDVITYTIRLQNNGTMEGYVKVRDTVPTGTSFVPGSVKVNGIASDNSDVSLASGIDMIVGAEDTATISFDVKVNDINNNDIIENIAVVSESNTNKVSHTYVEPIISSTKTVTTEYGRDYVVEGEKITYTINIKNDGGLAKDVLVKSTVPNGTSFVANSVKINGANSSNTADNLNSGIVVNVPEYGTATVSFVVTVNELGDDETSLEIKNKTTVDDEEVPDPDDGIGAGGSVIVKKSSIVATKESSVANGGKVKLGDVITYTIRLQNNGTMEGTVKVKDTVPTGTSFVPGSVKVNGTLSNNSDVSLRNGIDVTVDAGATATVSFDAMVDDIDNNDVIENVAVVNDDNTNKVSHTYVEPIISSKKTLTTEHGKDYVVEGEKLTYTVTIKNDGGLGKDVLVKSTIPNGTSFVANSVRINGESSSNTADNLSSGIVVNVPEYGTATVSFVVTVNELGDDETSLEIKNKTTVDDEEVPDDDDGTGTSVITVKKSNIVASQESTPVSGSKVKLGDVITYKVNVQNNGTMDGSATVKSGIPNGTIFVANSIRVNNSNTSNIAENLANGIDVVVPAGGIVTVSFNVQVKDLDNNDVIGNVATVNDVSTNRVSHTYVEPVISSSKSAITEHGKDYVVEGEKITYVITVKNDGGLAKDVIVKDVIPEGTGFVDGSIKVNEEVTTSTVENLNNGISVSVPANSSATLSFVVMVEELPEGTYLKEIRTVAVVDDNEVEENVVSVKKAHIIISKESNPESGSTVKVDDVITYIIKLDNDGFLGDTLTVKDVIPTGTTFVEGSVKVNDVSVSDKTLEDLNNGIELLAQAQKVTTLSFRVKVNKLHDRDVIRNVATVNDVATNEIMHTYTEPIISARKSVTTENDLDYVVEGERVTYTIDVANNGSLAKDVVVKDSIPEGMSFVANSIKVNGSDTSNTADDLANGIVVNVLSGGSATVSFVTTVDVLADNVFTKDIINIATVDDSDTSQATVTVKKSHILISNESNPRSGSKVKVDDVITYTIKLKNDGYLTDTVKVKNVIPNGTVFVDGSIRVNNEALADKTVDYLEDGIDFTIEPDATKEVSFDVKVKDLNDKDEIKHKAMVNDVETNETVHTYVEPIISGKLSSVTENGLDYVTENEKITYTVTAINGGGLAKDVVVKASIPDGVVLVDGSIKLGAKDTEYNLDDLESGISLSVPANKETRVSFVVRVDELDVDDEIRNVASVDGVQTNEVVHVYGVPSPSPSIKPSESPSVSPSVKPSTSPSIVPTKSPSVSPSSVPSESPGTSLKTAEPTATSTGNGKTTINNDSNVPYTGLENSNYYYVVPLMLVLVVLAVLSFVKYREICKKYRD